MSSGNRVKPVSAAEVGHDIADFLTERFSEQEECAVVGPLDDGLTILVMQPNGEHLMVQVNRCELVVR